MADGLSELILAELRELRSELHAETTACKVGIAELRSAVDQWDARSGELLALAASCRDDSREALAAVAAMRKQLHENARERVARITRTGALLVALVGLAGVGFKACQGETRTHDIESPGTR